jgi:PAS domain S-box-containing protein
VAVALVLGLPGIATAGATDVLLAMVAFVAVWAPLRIHRGGTVHGMTVEDAVAGAFVLGPHPELAPLALVAATLVARLLMRPGAMKVAYSLAPVGLGSAAAVAVARWIGPGADVLSWASAVTMAVAMLAYLTVSFVVTAGLFARIDGTRWQDIARDSWSLTLVSWVGNVTLGLLLAFVVTTDPRAIVLVGVLAVGVQLGYRAYGRMVSDRNRAQELSELNGALAAVAAGALTIDRWLDQVARFFSAQTAILLESGGQSHVSVAPPSAVLTAVSETRTGGGRREVGGSELLWASVRDGRIDGGVLALWGRHGLEAWNEGDVHLLAAIASEAAVALENAELFSQVERERARWQEESAKLTDILTAASDGIATVTSDGTVSSWNPGMAAVTGVDPDHAVGRPWWTLLRLRDVDGDDLLPEAPHAVTSALAGERHAEPVALQVLRRDGRWRWLRATFSPLVSDTGTVDGTVMVARDVTAEQEVEELKADFIATVSHELRTPLTPLKGFLGTLRQRRGQLSEERLDVIHTSMHSQVQRLERLVDDLLVVADLDRGRIQLGHELVQLRDAAAVAIGDEQDPDVDRVTVRGDLDVTAAADANAVVRILRALISNALKHTDGPVEVELTRIDRRTAVRVVDTGPGIPPWEQDRIFERFHRLGDHLLRTQGPGLGLSIARTLAHQIGGSISVESDVGQGATFTLRLRPGGPVAVGDDDARNTG